MNTEKKFGFATRQIHAGHMENAAGSLCAPIYQTSTFAFSTVQQGGARFAGEEGGYIYTRLGNPTLGAVEEKLASLEGGEAAMAAASGMGAISSALWTSVVAGDEIVAVNGRHCFVANDMLYELMRTESYRAAFTVRRDGKLVEL